MSIGRLLGDDARRAAIAKAGQTRTLAQHTYRHRASEILALVEELQASKRDQPRHKSGSQSPAA
jgi:spore maturation protein CgeB